MKIESWYDANFESRLSGRYITLDYINPILQSLSSDCKISSIGTSVLGREIPLICIGSGKKNVLIWSQMHGNESTTTKAIFDFIKLLVQKKSFKSSVSSFLKEFTLYIIPILNPDGATLYTRSNANDIDLNRDAQKLTQVESRLLTAIFNKIKPSLCLNMHDQRSIYGLDSGKPAMLSFLAPAADTELSVTNSRKVAMDLIAKMHMTLNIFANGMIGRYDDAFNANCVGDTFQMGGVPTILFEAGHSGNDYKREHSRKMVFYGLVSLFDLIDNEKFEEYFFNYEDIPENCKNYCDVLIKNTKIKHEIGLANIAIQFEEILVNQIIKFVPKIYGLYSTSEKIYGHKELNFEGKEFLLNSHQNIEIGQEILHINHLYDKFDDLFTLN